VLQGIEPEEREPRHVLSWPVDAEHPARLVHLIVTLAKLRM
jgi:hypothetical protein